MTDTEDGLVPGRGCGECSACCVTLRIEEAALKKYADVPCPNLRPEGGCSIYRSRPDVCRTWHCGWRLMKQLDDSWRPDRSNIIIRLDSGRGNGLVLQPIGKASELLRTEKVLSLVGGCVEAGFPVYISVPTKPGRCHALVQLNELFANAVASRVFEVAKLEMLKILERAYQTETDPIAPIDDVK
jgi:hypothetical protein